MMINDGYDDDCNYFVSPYALTMAWNLSTRSVCLKVSTKTGSFCLLSEQLLKSRIKIRFFKKVSFDHFLTLERVEKPPCTS
jgi:hypothetical protein